MRSVLPTQQNQIVFPVHFCVAATFAAFALTAADRLYTVKKRLAIFPSPAGMSLTKLLTTFPTETRPILVASLVPRSTSNQPFFRYSLYYRRTSSTRKPMGPDRAHYLFCFSSGGAKDPDLAEISSTPSPLPG
jgi:hypothetical protein